MKIQTARRRHRTRLRLALCLLALTGIAAVPDTSAAAPPSDPPPAWLDGFDAYVAEGVRSWEVPGLAVAVVVGGETVFSEGYGVLELGGEARVDPDTLFAIGSTTKALTAATLGMLVDAGEIAWDDPVVRHLPWFRVGDPAVTVELTVRDLLTHRGGLGGSDHLWYGGQTDTREILERLRHQEPAYSLRAGFVYQNVMYAAAGALLEEVTGTSWERFVEERLLAPLGMGRTTTHLAGPKGAASRQNVATPHDMVEGELVPIDNAAVDAVAPAGSIWSSVGDMSRWLAFLLRGCRTADGERLLAEATCDELFTPQTLVPRSSFYPTARLTRPHWTSYGLGWFQHDYRGEKVDFHTGSIDGMVAIAGLVRDEDVGVFVLANRDHAELRHALLYRVLDLALRRGDPAASDEPLRDWSAELRALYDGMTAEAAARAEAFEAERLPGTSPSLPLARYAGTYSHPLHGTVELQATPDGLALTYGERRGAVEHWHHDTFRVHWDRRWRGSTVFQVVLDPSAEPARLEIGDWVFERVPEEATE